VNQLHAKATLTNLKVKIIKITIYSCLKKLKGKAINFEINQFGKMHAQIIAKYPRKHTKAKKGFYK
jgi:hypothetical protein